MGYLWLFSIAMFVHWMITTIYVRPHGARIPHLRVIIELLREIPGKIQKSAREREPGWVHLVTLTISTKNSLYSEAMAMTLMKISLGLVMCDVCT